MGVFMVFYWVCFLVLPRVGGWLYYTDTMAVVKGIFVFLLFFCWFFVVFWVFLLYFWGARLRGWFPGFGFLVLSVPGAFWCPVRFFWVLGVAWLVGWVYDGGAVVRRRLCRCLFSSCMFIRLAPGGCPALFFGGC